MVRNTTSAGTVARTGIIRKPPEEHGETDSGDERKTSILIASSLAGVHGTARGFEHGIPGEQLAEAAGLSVLRVYQICDGRR
jgi:hypothetical protein